MSNIDLSEKINRAVEYLGEIFWFEIKEDNPLYRQIYDLIHDLCTKYDIKYNDNIDIVYNTYLESINVEREKIINDRNSYLNTQSQIFKGSAYEPIIFQNQLDIMQSVKRDLEQCTDISTLNRIELKYKDISNLFRIMISSYVKRHGELEALLNDEIEKAIHQINSQEPLEERKKPRMVSVKDEDGWSIEDEHGNEVSKLETEEEINQRLEYENAQNQQVLDNISKMKMSLAKWMEYLIVLPRLSSIYKSIGDSIRSIGELENQMVLNDFKKDEKFMQELESIMAHDVNEFEYLYHGTSCVEDAEKIMSEGLYMASSDLSRTTYSEFTLEELLLYKRGFGGEIGSSAVVIIRKPKGEAIVKEMTDEEQEKAQVNQSGLGGFTGMKYLIPREYIIGFVNKIDKLIIPQNLSDKKQQTI